MNESDSNGLRLPVRAALLYLISGALGKSVGLLMTPIFTRIMPPAEYGGYAYYMSLVGFGTLLSSAAYSQGVSYGGSARFGAERFFPALFSVSLLFSLVISLPIAFISGLTPTLGLALVFQMVADAAVGAYTMRSRYLYSYRTVCALSFFSSLCAPLLSIFLLGRGFDGTSARVYSLLSVSLAGALAALFALLFSKRAGFSREEFSYALKTALPFLPGALAGGLSAEADKLTVGRILGSGALAKYSVAYSIGASLHFVSTALSSALCPWIIRRVRRGALSEAEEPSLAVLSILFSLSLILTLGAPELLRILAPKSYAVAVYTVAPVALSVPLSFASGVCTLLLTEGGMARRAALLSGAGGVIGAALSLPLTLIFGLGGAALGGYIGSLITLFLLVSSLSKNALHSPFEEKRLLLYILSSGAFALLSVLLYPYTLLRIFLLSFPALFALHSLKSSYTVLFKKKKGLSH